MFLLNVQIEDAVICWRLYINVCGGLNIVRHFLTILYICFNTWCFTPCLIFIFFRAISLNGYSYKHYTFMGYICNLQHCKCNYQYSHTMHTVIYHTVISNICMSGRWGGVETVKSQLSSLIQDNIEQQTSNVLYMCDISHNSIPLDLTLSMPPAQICTMFLC